MSQVSCWQSRARTDVSGTVRERRCERRARVEPPRGILPGVPGEDDGIGPHYYNVPVEVLPELGKIVVIAARVEDGSRWLASGLGCLEPPGTDWPFSRRCKAVISAVDAGARAPLLAGDPEVWAHDVRAWCDRADPAMKIARNAEVHSTAIHLRLDGRWTSIRTDRATGVSRPVSPKYLSAARQVLERLANEVTELTLECFDLSHLRQFPNGTFSAPLT